MIGSHRRPELKIDMHQIGIAKGNGAHDNREWHHRGVLPQKDGFLCLSLSKYLLKLFKQSLKIILIEGHPLLRSFAVSQICLLELFPVHPFGCVHLFLLLGDLRTLVELNNEYLHKFVFGEILVNLHDSVCPETQQKGIFPGVDLVGLTLLEQIFNRARWIVRLTIVPFEKYSNLLFTLPLHTFHQVLSNTNMTSSTQIPFSRICSFVPGSLLTQDISLLIQQPQMHHNVWNCIFVNILTKMSMLCWFAILCIHLNVF
mmetsp:Transcript_4681/g.17598  ORF Transcript_4681/g.17598 Transcript_4681/m.17598 type:complete len:258 (-) Transcript_4681:128-901(-)